MNRSRLFRVVLTLTAVLAVSLLAPGFASDGAAYAEVNALAIPEFTIGGSGWGHGIGLSQYGAKGYAEHGKTGDWIATYYYPGSTIGARSDKTIKVNLDNAARYKTSSDTYNGGYTRTSWQVRPGYVGGQIKLNDSITLADKTWTITATKSGSTVLGMSISSGSTTYGPYDSIKLAPIGGSPGLIQVLTASGAFDHTYVRYRGTMRLYVNKVAVGVKPAGNIRLVNWLTTDNYLYGVVPRESPSSWHAEALKAQALVARSYAYVSTGELYCDTWSQVYNGHSKGDRAAPEMHEASSTNSAVAATSGRYVMYGGSVIQTFFHSSAGGHTANIEDVWLGTGQPSSSYPYRAGVPSPYEGSAGDPNASWPLRTMSGLQMAQKLVAYKSSVCPPGAGTSVYVVRLDPDRAASGHVRSIDIYWSNGYKTDDFSGDSFRSALALKSTNFFVAGFPMERIEGPTRYDTAAEISAEAFVGTAPVVVIASGEDYADALAGSALAGARNGSLLLSAKDGLPSATRDELRRLRPTTVYILGGESALSAAVASAAQSVAGLTPTRISGPDRYVTAARVADEVRAYAGNTSVLIASGTSWPDAASLSGLAYARGYPILLSKKTGLASATEDYLTVNSPATVLVAGGESVLTSAIDTQIRVATGKLPTRFAGHDRYQTATRIADYCVTLGFSKDNVYVATGEAYADALTGGVIAGVGDKPLILTQKDRCPTNTGLWLGRNVAAISKLYILGGTAAVSDAGLWSIDTAMAD